MTPADVSSKLFSRGMRGYNMEEVDTFLDEVEEELTRLLRENAELRQRVGAGTGAFAAPAPEPAAPPPPPAPTAVGPGEGQEAALRTLLLAQRTADQAIAEARAEAEEMVSRARAEADGTTESSRRQAEQAVSAARAEAEKTLTSARTESEQLRSSAKTESEQLRSSAKAESDRLLREARERKAAADAEVAAQVEAAMNGLESRRRELEGHIEELRNFEREYRTRLKAYLENQLRELDGRGGSHDAGAVVDVPTAPAAPAPASPGSRSPFAEIAEGPRPTLHKAEGPSFPAVEPAVPAPTSGGSSPFARPGGEPQQDGPLGLRAVPPLAEQGPEPVGPFTAGPPTGPPAGADGSAGTHQPGEPQH